MVRWAGSGLREVAEYHSQHSLLGSYDEDGMVCLVVGYPHRDDTFCLVRCWIISRVYVSDQDEKEKGTHGRVVC